MKKLFWCSVAAAVMAASCVYLASRHVERVPLTVVGHALVSLGGEENSGRELGGEAGGLPGDPSALPGLSEPTALEPVPEAAMEVVAVARSGQPGQITVEEPDPKTGTVPYRKEFRSSATEVEAMPMAAPPPPPSVMPYCQDDAEMAGKRMPYAEEDEAAAEDGDQSSEGVWTLLRRAAAEANDAMKAEEPTQAEQPVSTGHDGEDYHRQQGCPEDYHREHQVCPYTGRCYEAPAVCPAAPEPPEEKKKEEVDPFFWFKSFIKFKMPHEKTDENNQTRYHESRKMRLEEEEMPHLKLDTMEFRPSDAGLQPFVPGPF